MVRSGICHHKNLEFWSRKHRVSHLAEKNPWHWYCRSGMAESSSDVLSARSRQALIIPRDSASYILQIYNYIHTYVYLNYIYIVFFLVHFGVFTDSCWWHRCLGKCLHRNLELRSFETWNIGIHFGGFNQKENAQLIFSGKVYRAVPFSAHVLSDSSMHALHAWLIFWM